MVIRLDYFCVLWLNAFPKKLGVSCTHSPQEIVTGRSLSWDKHYVACFGDFIQASYDREGPGMPTNRTHEMCTYDAIYLGTTGNHQGTHLLFNLNTGTVKKPRTIRFLPAPDSVIEQVNKWGRRFQREAQAHRLIFLNRHQECFDWDS